jgi:hypothetical protein
MPPRKFNSRLLRQLAEELVQTMAEEGEIHPSAQGDCVTSLVRQWITYDGHATLFLSQWQIYLTLGNTPQGKPVSTPDAAGNNWMNQLTRDWKINPDDLPDIRGQLNRGQSAEVTNADGIPLRLWVNPKERSRGVEPLVKQVLPPGTKSDYRTIAAKELEQQLGDVLEPEELDELACSVAQQWQRHEGHACVFIDGKQQLFFRLTERDDGGCTVGTKRLDVDLDALLESLGFSQELIPEVIARINVGQEVQFRDSQGVPSVLWHDPKVRRIHVGPLAPVAPQTPSSSLPIFCPKCGAVLRPWKEGERRQTCPQCGSTASF